MNPTKTPGGAQATQCCRSCKGSSSQAPSTRPVTDVEKKGTSKVMKNARLDRLIFGAGLQKDGSLGLKAVEKESPRKEKERVKDEEELPLEIVKEIKKNQAKAAKPLANIFLLETAIANSVIIVE